MIVMRKDGERYWKQKKNLWTDDGISENVNYQNDMLIITSSTSIYLLLYIMDTTTRVNEETKLMTNEELPDYLDKMYDDYIIKIQYNKHQAHQVQVNWSDDPLYI